MRLAPEILRLTRVAATLLLGAKFAACGKPAEDPAGSAAKGAIAPFTGISSIAANADGTWTLAWPVVGDNAVHYLVYRAESGQPLAFAAPLFTTTETTYTTEALTFMNPQCYVVRYSSEQVISDTNNNAKCTTQVPYVFPGPGTLDQNDKGHFVLHWDPVPVPDPLYYVFAREVKEGAPDQYGDPFSVTREKFLDVGRPAREKVVCYTVSYGKADSAQNAELCKEKEPALDFGGIRRLEYTADTSSLKITWKGGDAAVIGKYVIYQGGNFDTEIGRVASDKTSFEVKDLQKDQIYSFGVRAIGTFDDPDDHDPNTKILTLRAGSDNKLVDDDGADVKAATGAVSP